MAKKSNGSPQYDGEKVSSKMGTLGLEQGDMSPKIDDYQKPMKNFSQEGFSKTLQYIERKDSFEHKEATDIEKQAYKGRYS